MQLAGHGLCCYAPTMTRRLTLALFAVLALMAPVAHAAETRPVTVFAASSLQLALNAIARVWQAETGKRVVLSFAGSPTLARQIDQGAPADIFASADEEWMDWAEGRNAIQRDSRISLLGNRLVLIARTEDTVALDPVVGFPLAGAIGSSRLATGHTQTVPAGRYAEAALRSLNVWESVRPRLAPTDTVRAAVNLVARGEARLGIVYASDTVGEPRIRTVATFPAQLHPPIRYPFALTARSQNPDAAGFLNYLSSPAARRLFEAQGFMILR
jgi:molybdate transport system substrate-binding protein